MGMKRTLFGILAAFFSVIALHGQGVAPDLFADAPTAKARPAAALQSSPSGLTPVRSRLVRLNLDAIDPTASAAPIRRRVRLNLFPGVDPEAVETRARPGAGPGRFEWFGRPDGDPLSDIVLSVVDGRVSGSLSLRQGFFQIRHVEGDIHEITEIQHGRLQTLDDAVPPPNLPTAPVAAKLAAGPVAVAAAGDPVVDVLVVYTPEAKQKVGGSQKIQDKIALAIAEINASVVNSQAAIEFRLAGMAEVPISGAQGPTGAFLDQVSGFEPDIQSLRNYYGADLVSVWVGEPSGGVIGIAWLNPGPPNDFSDYAYGVVAVSYANGPNYTFAHEAGHNLGGAHNRENAGSPGAFPYSYGYRYDPNPGGGFYTIMSYSSGCGGCSPTNLWSNPNVLVEGQPAGKPQGQADAAYNAATLTAIAPAARDFRATQSPAANSAPAAANQSRTVFSSQPASITLTAVDANGDTVYFDTVSQPVHGDLSGAGANWTYTGNIGYSGPDSFQFEARDNHGGFDVATVTLNVQLPSTTPPNVSLAAPSGGPFTAPATINLSATATDSDGTVDHVDFYANGVKIGTKTSATSSYTFTWTNVLDGSYSVTAVAQDNLGATQTSNAVSVNVAQGTAGDGYTTRLARLFYAFDEGSGSTVADSVGAHHGAIGGSAAWTSLGLQGGWVDSSVASFTGNKLSAASGDAFTAIWVGKLGSGSSFQTLFSMGGSSAANLVLRYYQPNGYLYLTLNNQAANYYNAGALLGKVVMITVRCAAGSCSWRVGGGSWINGNVGSSIENSPNLNVGSDFNRWAPLSGSASALFWVYADALANTEIDANFQYAGSTLAGRGFALDGYSPAAPNAKPVAQDQTLTTPYQTSRAITLYATDADGDPLSYSVLSGPSHGALSGAAPNVTYTPANGYSGPDSFTFQASDSKGGSDTGLISLTVGPAPNTPPNVSLAAPAGGPFTAPASLTLVATATDSNGSIDHVEFLVNGLSIGSSTSATTTFSKAWNNVSAGVYTVYARAFDNLGATANSASISVTVNESGSAGAAYTTRAARLYYAFDEGAGATVFDYAGANHGTVGGAASWTPLGLKGGWVDTHASSFSGNKLSPASNAFTLIWVGKLDTGSNYQTLFTMGDSATNVQLRYYQPSGSMYLTLNGNPQNYRNVSTLLGKNIMVTLRCAGGACLWRVGGSGAWSNGLVGTAVAANPLLQVGTDVNHWAPLINSTSALFWVYGDFLNEAEVNANFDFAAATLNARGAPLDGYVGPAPNSPPNVSLAAPAGGPFTAPAAINLAATATDPGGSIDHVEFFANGASIGSSTSATSNFSRSWTNVAAGVYSVYARAFDNLGATKDSAPVSVTVNAPSSGGSYATRAALLHYGFDEGAGATVFDQVGSHHGAVGGAATWTSIGLKGGYADSGVSSFNGNRLSPASNNAFTVVWVGKLDTGSTYQTLFSMGGSSASNVVLRYYQPNGYLYLTLNNQAANYYNAGALLGKVVMITVRCAAAACSWRVGGAGAWINGNIGSSVDLNPLLQVGSDFNHWIPLANSVSSLFWVYGASLTNAEVDANFQYAGAALNARGALLDGYTPTASNTNPAAQSANVKLARDRYGFVHLAGSDPDGDNPNPPLLPVAETN
jgi:hypothetical protein